MSQPVLTAELALAVARVERRLNEVADAMVTAYARESPHYAPAGLDIRNIYPVMAHNVRVVSRYLVSDLGDPEPDDAELGLRLESLTSAAQLRAQEGLPIIDLVDSHWLAFSILWSAVLDELGPRSPSEVDAVFQALARRQRRVTRIAVEGYESEAASIGAETRAAEYELIRGLVSGAPHRDLAARRGVELSPSYQVLWFVLGQTQNERCADEVGRRTSGRRKARRVRDELKRRLGNELLVELEPSGGIALLPMPAASSSVPPARLRELLIRLATVAQASVHAGMVPEASVAELPDAVDLARELGELVAGRPEPALGLLADLQLELQLSQDTHARRSLARLAGGLGPELSATLRAYFAHDFNRKRVARELGVHPNTVDNRLARIAEVTGADPRTARGLMLLGSALTVGDLGLDVPVIGEQDEVVADPALPPPAS